MTSRNLLIATLVGVTTAIASLCSFGYLVAYHPLGIAAERSSWLVPLLHLLAWLPFVSIGSIVIGKLFPETAAKSAFFAGISALLFTLVSAAPYFSAQDFLSILGVMWLQLFMPITLFLVAGVLLANKSSQPTPYRGG